MIRLLYALSYPYPDPDYSAKWVGELTRTRVNSAARRFLVLTVCFQQFNFKLLTKEDMQAFEISMFVFSSYFCHPAS